MSKQMEKYQERRKREADPKRKVKEVLEGLPIVGDNDKRKRSNNVLDRTK